MIDSEWKRLVSVLAKRYPGSFKWGVLIKKGRNDAFLSEQAKPRVKYHWRS